MCPVTSFGGRGAESLKMIDEDNADREQRAQRKMSETALSLQRLFSPIDAAGLMIGAAVGILEVNFGRRMAAAYVEGLAREMRGEPSEDEPKTIN